MNTRPKIITLPTLRRKIARYRRSRKKIAFTNGCFDLLHAGHVRYLETAKKPGRILVVGLNNDRSVRKIKGNSRPVLPEKDRAALLAGLACVDHVVLFGESTPEKLIRSVRPDILIKGADWKNKGVVGSAFVRANGGRVEFVKLVKGRSSTNIIGRVLKNAKTKKR